SGATGWAATRAAYRGADSPVRRAYPAATTVVAAHTSAAYPLGRTACATPARLTYQAAYPSSPTSSRPSAAAVSAVPVSPRRPASGPAARTRAVTAARMAARPVTPTVAHATAVNTTAAHASSSPPSTYSTFCTVRVDVSGPAGRAGGAVEAGAAGATKAAARIRADTRAARSLRRRRTSS